MPLPAAPAFDAAMADWVRQVDAQGLAGFQQPGRAVDLYAARWAAFLALPRDDFREERLLAAATHPHVAYRALFLMVMEYDCGHRRVLVEALLDLLRALREPDEFWLAQWANNRLRSAPVAEVVQAWAEHPVWQARYAWVSINQRHCRPWAVPRLIQRAADTEDQVAWHALHTLAGPETYCPQADILRTPAITDLMVSRWPDDPFPEHPALIGLAWRQHPMALPAIQAGLERIAASDSLVDLLSWLELAEYMASPALLGILDHFADTVADDQKLAHFWRCAWQACAGPADHIQP